LFGDRDKLDFEVLEGFDEGTSSSFDGNSSSFDVYFDWVKSELPSSGISSLSVLLMYFI
jgi:hypothetical protein